MGQSQVIFQKVCREKQKRYIWSIKSLQTLPFFLLWRSAKPVSPAPSSGLSLSKIENWTFFCQKIPFQNRKHCTWGNFFCWLRGIYELIICFEIFHHELKWIWSNLYSARLVVSPKQKLSCITNCSYSHLFRKPTIFKRFWQFSQGGDPQRMSFYADLIWCRLCQSTATHPMQWRGKIFRTSKGRPLLESIVNGKCQQALLEKASKPVFSFVGALRRDVCRWQRWWVDLLLIYSIFN